MTVAICLQCGARKVGAFTPCPGCGFDPNQAEDRAKALMLSDRFLPAEQLDAVADQIRCGAPPRFDPESLEQMTAELAKVDWRKEERSASIFIWGCLLVAVMVVLALVYLITRVGR